MIVTRNSKTIEICDLCGGEINTRHAYTEGLNLYCSFDCMDEVNDMVPFAEEILGEKKSEHPELDDQEFILMARRRFIDDNDRDIGETDWFNPAGNTPLVHPLHLLPLVEYKALSRKLSSTFTGAYMLTPSQGGDGKWRAKTYLEGNQLGGEVIWPRGYSKSFLENIAYLLENATDNLKGVENV